MNILTDGGEPEEDTGLTPETDRNRTLIGIAIVAVLILAAAAVAVGGVVSGVNILGSGQSTPAPTVTTTATPAPGAAASPTPVGTQTATPTDTHTPTSTPTPSELAQANSDPSSIFRTVLRTVDDDSRTAIEKAFTQNGTLTDNGRLVITAVANATVEQQTALVQIAARDGHVGEADVEYVRAIGALPEDAITTVLESDHSRWDRDGDGLANGEEVVYGTDPLRDNVSVAAMRTDLANDSLTDRELQFLKAVASLGPAGSSELEPVTQSGSIDNTAVAYVKRLQSYRELDRTTESDNVAYWRQIRSESVLRGDAEDGTLTEYELSGLSDDDGDGLLTVLERLQRTNPEQADTDRDGFNDRVERYGLSQLDTGALHPRDPDVVVEVDRTERCTPLLTRELDQMKQAFHGGPSKPIFLTVVYEDVVPGAEGENVSLDEYSSRYSDGNNRTKYGVLTHNEIRLGDEGVDGFAIENRFAVRCDGGDEAYIFMHELGHTLGLIGQFDHIDSTEVPFSENRSTMNYNAPRTFFNFTEDEWDVVLDGVTGGTDTAPPESSNQSVRE